MLLRERHYFQSPDLERGVHPLDFGTIEGHQRYLQEIDTVVVPNQLEAAVFYNPIGEVGGDIFRFVYVPNGMDFMVADVEGKGIPAAQDAALLDQAYLQAIHQALLDPGEILDHLHDQLRNHTKRSASAVAGSIRNRILTYQTAGHRHPLIIRNGAPIDSNPQTQMPLLNTYFYEAGISTATHSLELASNDLVIIYTDGIEERLMQQTANRQLIMAENWIPQLDFNADAKNLAALRDWIMSHFGQGVQTDDLTLLVIRILE